MSSTLKVTNCVFIDCAGGVSIPENFNLDAENSKFKRVPDCFNIRKVNQIRTEHDSLKIKINNPTEMNNFNSIENETKQIVRNLFNLEILSIINKDYKKLKKIRKIKGLIGSGLFKKSYIDL